MNDMTKYEPEKLNLWDRIFNRYKKIPVRKFNQAYSLYNHWNGTESPTFYDMCVEYHVVDRLTGSYTIKVERLW